MKAEITTDTELVETVFRVENEQGVGPYRSDNLCDGILNHHNGSKKHPNPWHDPLIHRYMEKDEFCGFESLDALFEWFSDEEIDALELQGYYMVQTQGIVTAKGEKQLLFKKIPTHSQNHTYSLFSCFFPLNNV